MGEETCKGGKTKAVSHNSTAVVPNNNIASPPSRTTPTSIDCVRPEDIVGFQVWLCHLPRLAKYADGDHEGVEHLVLLEQTATDVGEHVQAHVIDQDPVACRSRMYFMGGKIRIKKKL